MVQLFLDGGGFMWPILIIFIFGFVFVGERLYHIIKGMASNFDFANEVSDIVKSDGFKTLKDGQAVEFTLVNNEKGESADEVIAV